MTRVCVNNKIFYIRNIQLRSLLVPFVNYLRKIIRKYKKKLKCAIFSISQRQDEFQ